VISRVRGLLVLAAVCCASCGAPLMKLPSGPGTPAADAADALAQATSVCRGIRTLTAEVGASGKVGGQRFRARLSVGVAAPASARIEAMAPFGAPLFVFASDNDDTTVLLPRDDRVLQHGGSADVLDAVAGVALSAASLHAVLTGCPPMGSWSTGQALGADWRRIEDVRGGHVYLHRVGAPQLWQLVLIDGVGWHAEFREFVNGLPRSIRIASSAGDDIGVGSVFDLTLTLSQVDTNVTLGPEVFHVSVPPTAKPITLGELTDARPGTRKN
jgi:hypothetical protein